MPSSTLDLKIAFLEHARSIERFLVRLGVDHRDAPDLMAETFLSAHQQRDRFDEGRPVRPWLFGIAANLARRYQRRRWLWSAIRVALTNTLSTTVEHEGERDLLRYEESSRVRRVLAALPHRKRELLVLRELEGLSGSEIAQVLGIAEGSVYAALHYARKEFVRCYERQLAEDER